MVYEEAMLELEQLPLHLLTEDPDNARVHDKKNIKAIEESLRLYGQVEPLVVRKSNNVVIGGNGRLACMKNLGFESATVVRLDVDETTAKSLSVALNRTGELAKWDFEKLGELFREFKVSNVLDDLAIGWTEYELGPILQAEWKPPDPEGELVSFTADNKGLKVRFDEEQAKIVQQCIEYFRVSNPKWSEAEILTSLAQSFLECLE